MTLVRSRSKFANSLLPNDWMSRNGWLGQAERADARVSAPKAETPVGDLAYDSRARSAAPSAFLDINLHPISLNAFITIGVRKNVYRAAQIVTYQCLEEPRFFFIRQSDPDEVGAGHSGGCIGMYSFNPWLGE